MNIDINEESDTNLHHNHLIINSGAFESFADQVQNKINYENYFSKYVKSRRQRTP